MRNRLCVLTFVCLATLSTGARAAIIHVPTDEPTIQAGLGAASDGDTVVVAPGFYYEHSLRLTSGVHLRSETGEPDCVTIDALDQYLICVLWCDRADSPTTLEGFTITGGLNPEGGGMWCRDASLLTIRNVTFSGNVSDFGGGLFCLDSSPTLEHVAFLDNWAYLDGGGVWSGDSSPTLVGCTFSGNTAERSGGGLYSNRSSCLLADCSFVANTAVEGGAVHTQDLREDPHTSTELTGCAFYANSAGTYGGAVSCLYNYWPPGAITNAVAFCSFFGNTAGAYGGAVHIDATANLNLTECAFAGNSADICGGGLSCTGESQAQLSGCSFTANTAHDGGAVYGGDVSVWSSTFSENAAANAGGSLYFYPVGAPCGHYSYEIQNCIIAFGVAAEAVYAGSWPSDWPVTCTNIYGNAGGDWTGALTLCYGTDGNISEDPLFCGDEHPDEPFALHANSPCAPDGNPECGLIGAWGVGCQATAVEEISWGALKAMFR